MIVTRNNPIPTVRAIRVASFTGTIGVNTHLNDIAGPYGNVANVLAEMSYIGSSALRDNNAYSWSLPNYINLETHGIKLDIILTHNPGEEIAYGGLQSDISLLDQMAAACAGGTHRDRGPERTAELPRHMVWRTDQQLEHHPPGPECRI